MKIHTSGEDYLEAVLILQKKQGMVRSIDLARHMGFSKPSISHAVGVLKNGGFLTVDDDGFLHLTAIGREIAEKIYERHLFFMEQFIAAGVDQETAEQDACRIEHAISDTSFRKLKENLEEKGVKERREQQVAEKNESREAVPRAGVEINTAVKDAGKAERKAVAQKKAMPGKEKKPSIHERLEINKRIIQEKQGKDKPERGADLGVRTV